MKVLHLVSDFSNSSETFIYDLVVDMEELGIDNHVVTNRHINKVERPFSKVISFDIDHRNIFEKILKRGRRKLLNDYHVFEQKKLQQVVNDIQPDVVHSHFNYFFENIHDIIKSGFRGRVIISTHGIDVVNNKLYGQPQYVEKVYKCQQHDNIYFTAPSNYLKRKLQEIFGIAGEKIIVLPNCVNISMADFKEKEIDPAENIYIVNVGRFVGFKGQAYLIDALSRLHENGYKQVRLKLIGFGPLESALRQQAVDLGLEGAVDFKIDLPREKIFEELSSSDIYIQSSVQDEETGQEESFGIAVLEAISVGLPVVVTDSGGLPDTICAAPYQPMTQIIDAKSSQGICQAVVDIIESEHPPLKKEQVDDLLSHFSTDSNRGKILELYRGA
ncbi:glycosyltransferase family 4 protein [Kushneria indalinina]|uniref:Glycosyltransferase involved in cell wall biosynthesis n=1 Tax=Kushneria indalinina DSM 14324 TaxID=1122140 RepID=A0A3D9E0E1_9GAMM|nr:glycosyltransferase family 4 protein [Kushneria indalinina]REC96375.1 glycosyltransferase involved in cell wall biosynthesis [Kushneria indalinina DSM 14324]